MLFGGAEILITFAGPIQDLLVQKRVKTVLFIVVQANVAQLVEQLICNQQVGGSNPPVGSVFADLGRYPSGQRGQTVNLLAHAFAGSNPALPTDPHGALRCFFKVEKQWTGSLEANHARVAQLVVLHTVDLQLNHLRFMREQLSW